MKYSVREIVPFTALETGVIGARGILFLTLDHCRERLRNEGVGTFNSNVVIRPWPRGQEENSRDGYARNRQRAGLEIIMSSITD